MSKFIVLTLLLALLGGCTSEDGADSGINAPEPTPVMADRATLLKVSDDATAGRQPPAKFQYRDPETGTFYLVNPNWRIMQRGPAALGKTNALLQTWTDWSGQVEVRIYDCSNSANTLHQNNVACQVEPEFTLVGGGAYVDYGAGAGALLWETRPLDAQLVTWVATSKDHVTSCPHILHTYAYGMRLKDNSGKYIPASYVKQFYVRLSKKYSSPAVHAPYDVLNVLNDDPRPRVYGGGARTTWSCCGSLLTKVSQSSTTVSTGAKDHGSSDPATLATYAIYFPGSDIPIPNFGLLFFNWKSSVGSSVGTGVAAAYVDASERSVITGVGGESKWTSGTGRLLFGIKPTGTYRGQVGVFSKDHKSGSAGYTIATVTEVSKY